MSSRMVSILMFFMIFTTALSLDRVARRPGSRIPTFGDVFGFLAQKPIGRAIVLGFWAWSGWHFFAR